MVQRVSELVKRLFGKRLPNERTMRRKVKIDRDFVAFAKRSFAKRSFGAIADKGGRH